MFSVPRLIVVTAFGVLGCCAAPQEALEWRVLNSHNLMRHAGFPSLGPINSGELTQDNSQTHRAHLSRNACYVLTAFGANTIEDIGLTVVGPDESPLAEERGSNRTATVSFCTEHGGEHLFTVTAESGSGEYRIAYWSRGEEHTDGESGGGQQLTLGRSVSGTLTPEQRSVDYTLQLRERRIITIDLESRDFDAFLYLIRDGVEIERNDDGGEGLNSRISLPLDPGTYTVRVTSFMDRGAGQYTLVVR